MPLPQDVVGIAADLALGADGTIYITYVPVNPPDDRKRLMVCALTVTGDVRWTTPTDIEYFNSRLRTAPDGSVFWEGSMDIDDGTISGIWTPVASPDGEPLSLAEQRAGASPYQPMPGDLRFEGVEVGEGAGHRWDLTLLGHDGKVVGAWRVTSADDLGGMVDEPGMVDGDPIVTLEVARQTPDDYLYEYVTVRLPDPGESATEISLDPHAVRVDVPVTGLRVGPDGRLYQLRSDIDTGIGIAAYRLAAAPTSPPPSTPPPGKPSSPPPTTTPAAVTPPIVTPPPVTPTIPTAVMPRHAAAPIAALSPTAAASKSPLRWVVASVVALALVGLGTWLLFWRRIFGPSSRPEAYEGNSASG